MSSSMALRRSPKPGALTAAPSTAAQLIDDEGGESLALGHPPRRSAAPAALHDGLEDRQHRLQAPTASSHG